MISDTIIKDKVIFIIGLILPFFMVLLFPEAYHHYDVTTFIEWNGYSKSFNTLYTTDCVCNYPYMGLAVSSGFLRIFSENIQLFRLFLSIIDAGVIIVLLKILQTLNIKRALLWSGIIALLPSSWVGTSYWGQIDNIGQLLLILFIYFLLVNLKNKDSLYYKKFKVFLFIAAFICTSMLLVKQLLLFSLTSCGLLLFYLVIKKSQNFIQILLNLFILIFAALLPLIIIDLTVDFKKEFISHLHQIIATGSDHMKKISGNGFNIWMFLNREMKSSSDAPFLSILTPRNTGILFYILYYIFITVLVIKQIYNEKINSEKTIVFFIIHLAMINLGFNLLLSGTHERYLIHFYPYLFIFLLYYNDKFRGQIQIGIYGAVLYGFFVWLILYKPIYFYSHMAIGVFHIIYFIQLNFLLLPSSFNKQV